MDIHTAMLGSFIPIFYLSNTKLFGFFSPQDLDLTRRSEIVTAACSNNMIQLELHKQ